MANKQLKVKEMSMPNLVAAIQDALDKLLGADNVVDWQLDLTTTLAKFDALGRANQRYLSSDKIDLVYVEGDKELIITCDADEIEDDFETEAF